jgi:CHRD domain-containing protein
MSDGNAYVNVHTDKYPDGAIRGQISSGETETVATSTESNNMTSENTSAPVMESDSNLTQSGNTTS